MIKKLTIMLLVLLAISMCGCNAKSPKDGSSDDFYELSKGEVVLSGFESIKELQSMSFRNNFGIASLTQSSQYVTQGKNAAGFKLLGNKLGGAAVHQTTKVHIFVKTSLYVPRIDYKKVTGYKIDIFNAGNRPVGFIMGLNDNCFQFDTMELQPGMNNVSVSLNWNEVKNLLNYEEVECIDFNFEGKPNDEEYTTLFVDNLRAVIDAEKALSERAYVKQLGGETPFDFSQSDSIYSMNYFGSATSYFNKPKFTINRNPAYIKTGNGSLKVDFFTNIYGSGMDTIGFRTTNYATSFMDFNGQDPDNTYLSFDFFNSTNKSISLTVMIFSGQNKNYACVFVIKANSWSENCKLLLRDVLTAHEANHFDVMTVTFQFSGLTGGDAVYLDNISFKK